MGKKATKAADNVYCIARYKAAEEESKFDSRESTAELIGMDRTRLARIELGIVNPYPEEVLQLAKAYGSPELCNVYCSKQCPIGEKTVRTIEIEEFNRIALKALGSLQNADELREKLIQIAADGVISEDEHEDFNHILEELQRISMNAQALQLWADKHIELIHNREENQNERK